MSVTVNIYYTGENKNAHKFVQEMESSGTADKIRNVYGNEKYEYYLSVKNPETVLLIDKWADQNAIDEHHKSEMMNTIIALRNKYDLHMRVERFISDEKGVPEADNKFIRE